MDLRKRRTLPGVRGSIGKKNAKGIAEGIRNIWNWSYLRKVYKELQELRVFDCFFLCVIWWCFQLEFFCIWRRGTNAFSGFEVIWKNMRLFWNFSIQMSMTYKMTWMSRLSSPLFIENPSLRGCILAWMRSFPSLGN